MPVLENHRHELFAQALAQGKSPDEAYTGAGYTPNRANASRLKAHESVRGRVEELLERSSRSVMIDRQWVLDKLVENATYALRDKDRNAANRSLELVGKELGMFVDRKEIRTGPLEEATPDELERLREELVGERARRAIGGNGTAPSGKPN